MNITPANAPSPRYPALAALAVATTLALPSCNGLANLVFLTDCDRCKGDGRQLITDEGRLPYTQELKQKYPNAATETCPKCIGTGTMFRNGKQAVSGALILDLSLSRH